MDAIANYLRQQIIHRLIKRYPSLQVFDHAKLVDAVQRSSGVHPIPMMLTIIWFFVIVMLAILNVARSLLLYSVLIPVFGLILLGLWLLLRGAYVEETFRILASEHPDQICRACGFGSESPTGPSLRKCPECGSLMGSGQSAPNDQTQ